MKKRGDRRKLHVGNGRAADLGRTRARTHALCTCVRRGRGKTFKPQKNIAEGTKQYQLKKYAEATLGSGNLRLAVALPEGEDLNEWLAVNSACMA